MIRGLIILPNYFKRVIIENLISFFNQNIVMKKQNISIFSFNKMIIHKFKKLIFNYFKKNIIKVL